MAYREHLPHPALRPFIDRFWTLEAPAETGPRRILPDGCIDLIVNLTRGGPPVAVGTMTRTAIVTPRARDRLAAVRFRPGAAVPFLRIPADQLTDRQADLAQLGLRGLIPPGLGDSEDPMRAIAAFERTLLEQLPAVPPRERPLHHAVRALLQTPSLSIDAVAAQLGCSRQHLGRRFRAQVGIGPKQFARVARLQRTVAELQDAPDRNAADLAAGMGYFDQAHMIREFAALVGTTPQRVRRAAGSIFPIRSLRDGT